MTDTLYFSADEVMKGIRLLYNEMTFEMFKRDLGFTEHGHEYVMAKFASFGKSPFQFWCSIDEDKRAKLNFLIDEAASLELHRERKLKQKPLLETLDKVMD